MSGLFLNFYQIEIDLKEVSVKALNYSDYQSKEDCLKKEIQTKSVLFIEKMTKYLYRVPMS